MAAGLTRRVGMVALGRAAGTLSILLVNAVAARAWPAADVGVFRAVWTLGNTLVPIFLLGLPTSLLYFFPRRPGTAHARLVAQIFICLLASAASLALLLWTLGPQLSAWLHIETRAAPVDLERYLLPFLPYLCSLVAGGFAEAALVAASRPGWQAGLALGLAFNTVAAMLLGAGMELGLEEMLWIFSGLGVLRLLVALWLVGRAVGFAVRRPWGAGWGEVLSYSWPIGLNDTVGALSRSVDRLVVLFFFSAETFGLYDLGAVEVPISLLLAAVVTVLVPEVSHLYREGRLDEIGALWRRALRRLSLIALPLCFFLLVFSDPFMGFYLPASYAGAEWVFRIFLLTLPLRAAVYNPLLAGMGKARWALWGGLGDLGLNFILSLAFVHLAQERWPQWAFLGPAAATVAATYLQVGFLVGAIARHLHWSLGQLLPWGALGRLGGLSAAAALAGRAAVLWTQTPLVQLIAGGGIFAALLGGALWLHPREREELAQLFTSLCGRRERHGSPVE